MNAPNETAVRPRPVGGGRSRAGGRECQCSRPVVDGFLCTVCVKALRRMLDQVAGVAADLQVTVLRQDRIGQASAGGGSFVAPLPVNLSASYALQRLVDAVRGFLPAAAGKYSVATLARLAVLNLGNQLASPLLPPLFNELTDAMVRARQITDMPPTLVYTGPCGAIIEGVECVEELWAGPKDEQVHCRVCGTTWGVAARRASALHAVKDLAYGPELLSRALTNYQMEVTRQDLHYWWRLGLVTRCVSTDGKATYRVGQVMEAWHTMQERGRGKAKRSDTP